MYGGTGGSFNWHCLFFPCRVNSLPRSEYQKEMRLHLMASSSPLCNTTPPREIASCWCSWPDGRRLTVSGETRSPDPLQKLRFAVDLQCISVYSMHSRSHHSSTMSEEYNDTIPTGNHSRTMYSNRLLMLDLHLQDLHRKHSYCEESGECAYLHFDNLVTNSHFHTAGE